MTKFSWKRMGLRLVRLNCYGDVTVKTIAEHNIINAFVCQDSTNSTLL